jgi:hypothetical protein
MCGFVYTYESSKTFFKEDAKMPICRDPDVKVDTLTGEVYPNYTGHKGCRRLY